MFAISVETMPALSSMAVPSAPHLVSLEPIRQGLVTWKAHQLRGFLLAALGFGHRASKVVTRDFLHQLLEVKARSQGPLKNALAGDRHCRQQRLANILRGDRRPVAPD